jgi:hypothetical protein
LATSIRISRTSKPSVLDIRGVHLKRLKTMTSAQDPLSARHSAQQFECAERRSLGLAAQRLDRYKLSLTHAEIREAPRA